MSITIAEIEGIRHMMTPDPAALRQQLIEQAQGDPELLIDLVTIYCIDILNVERDVVEFSTRSDMHDDIYTSGEAQGIDNASEAIKIAFATPHPDWIHNTEHT
jgi:hypothetical protein